MKKKVDRSEEVVSAEAVKETGQAYMAERALRPRRRNVKPDRQKANNQADRHEESPAFSIPEFRTQEEYEAWWDALPKVKAEVDPRLREKVKTSIRLSRRTIEGFDFLAKQKGIRSGQTLMKVVLETYLSKSLPPDF